MSAPIDVLAVMGKSANAAKINATTFPESRVLRAYAEDVEQVRAVVAELIEALRETTAAIGYLNRAYPPGELAGAWQRNDAFDKAKSALARITGDTE